MILRYKIIAILIMAAFYVVYIGKMLSQKKQGIVTNQIGKDKSDKARYRVEIWMKIATYSIIVVELISILWGQSLFQYSCKTLGILLGIIGDAFFLTAVLTMADSWRAGVAAEEHRKFVCRGIFKISRNPAFVGFDLVYISILLMFFNWFLLIFTCFAILMLHLQMLQEEKYLVGEFGREYVAYRKRVCRYIGLRSWKFWTVVCVVAVAVAAGCVAYLNSKIEALPGMTFAECLEYTTHGNSDAVISVGIYKDGEMSYRVYGQDGRELEPVLHTYEIGSLTKTMTAACINRAMEEGELSLNDSIEKFLDLPADDNYPTVAKLLTHTAGYKGYYLNRNMIGNAIIGGAPFRYVTGEQVVKEAGKQLLTSGSYDWKYSNFGYALLGQILEQIYGDKYVAIINRYLTELGMTDSAVRSSQGDLGNCWKWELTDAYASAGAVQSNIADMLLYAKLQLTDASMQETHKSLRVINASSADYEAMGIYMDEIGMAWILDNTNGFIWHNGGTDNYNSYLGFCEDTQTAVVILSNLPSEYRIPATVMGTKLLMELQK